MLRALAIACCLAPAIAAADGSTPLLVQVGADYLGDELRKALETDWGYHAGIATLIAESGMIGVPSLDLDFRYAPDGEGNLFAFEACYAERSLIGGQWWFGAGFGSNYVRLRLDTTSKRQEVAEQRWSIGGKAMLGYLLTDRVFVEGTFHYVGEVLNINASSASISLGYWF